MTTRKSRPRHVRLMQGWAVHDPVGNGVGAWVRVWKSEDHANAWAREIGGTALPVYICRDETEDERRVVPDPPRKPRKAKRAGKGR